MLPVQEQKPVTQAANQIVKDIEQTQTTPVAPAGLQLVSLAPKQDDAPPPASDNKPQGGSGSGGSAENKKDVDEKDKDKKKDAQEQKPAGGEKKDGKPKKNYCN